MRCQPPPLCTAIPSAAPLAEKASAYSSLSSTVDALSERMPASSARAVAMYAGSCRLAPVALSACTQ